MGNVVPGWYADASNTLRWWDGQGWTSHVRPALPAHHAPYVPTLQQPMIVSTGRPVRFYKTSYGLHLFLTIITFGAWGLVWIAMAIYNSSRSN